MSYMSVSTIVKLVASIFLLITPCMFQPERLSGYQYYKDTDMWSLGIILIECATGRCPTPDAGFWDLLAYLTQNAPPRLPDTFSLEFRDFVSICLRPEGGTRTSAQQLLEHDFAIKYVALDKKLLKKWVKAL